MVVAGGRAERKLAVVAGGRAERRLVVVTGRSTCGRLVLVEAICVLVEADGKTCGRLVVVVEGWWKDLWQARPALSRQAGGGGW